MRRGGDGEGREDLLGKVIISRMLRVEESGVTFRVDLSEQEWLEEMWRVVDERESGSCLRCLCELLELEVPVGGV